MAKSLKRLKKSLLESIITIFIWMFLIGMCVTLFIDNFESIVVIFVLGIIGLLLYAFFDTKKKRKQARERLLYLREKYKDERIVQKILNGEFWVGQKSWQLFDSLGEPVKIDRVALKTKKKETWKYRSLGSNRFALKIILENDVVVGWDEKG